MGHSARTERRRSPRISVELAARLRFGDSALDYPQAHACDISTDGIGIVVRGVSRQVDALKGWSGPVSLEVDLLDGTTIELLAELAWARREQREGEGVSRLGFRFVEMAEGVRAALARLTRQRAG